MAAEGNIKGFVVIKLPRPGDPSLKKTFEGAFIFADSPNHLNPSSDLDPDVDSRAASRDDQPEENYRLPLHSPNEVLPTRTARWQVAHHLRRLLHVAFVLFIAMVACLFWLRGPSTMMVEEDLESRDDDGSDGALVFNVYSKLMIYHNSNASWLPSIPAYPESASPESPSAMSQIIARDVVRHQSRLGTAAGSAPISDSKEVSSTVFPLGGNVYPDGLFYVLARLGNPPREYFLDMDTGSDITWLQCDAPCANCAKGPHALYKPRRSILVDCSEAACSSVQEGSKFGCDHGRGQCDYEIMYADGGYSLGVLVRDQLVMKMANLSWGYTKVIFGCAYNQQGSLAKSPTATDGVLGLSSSSVSLPSQLAEQGIIKNMFAHCIPGDGSNGGYLLLGDKLLPTKGITWTPMLGKPAMKNYVVAVDNVFFGDLSLQSGHKGSGQAIFDSGSSYSYLTSSLYATLTHIIQQSIDGSGLERDLTDNTLPFCWKSSEPIRALKDVSYMFKPLVFEFRSSGWSWKTSSGFSWKTSRMQLSPEGYLITNARGNVCLGFLDGSVMQNGGLIIIGDISMQGSLVVYDNENHQIGWMKADCRKISNAT